MRHLAELPINSRRIYANMREDQPAAIIAGQRTGQLISTFGSGRKIGGMQNDSNGKHSAPCLYDKAVGR
jgi:hypothetical protein